jgi:Uncharacterized protein involved in cytokinesis, contains TGc (transglutaminase/protease-like) domain
MVNQLKINVFIVFLLFQTTAFSQDKLKVKTLTIVDTSKTKLEQAQEIYDWITRHISYDVEAYLHGDYSYKSPESIFARKKGICKDYSALFDEMCHDVGVESYTIIGYAPGPDFFKGDGFYRANHSWNVVQVDSIWYLADLTWGSGYLKHVPLAFDLLKHRFLKTPIVNRNWVFVKSPDEKYFNPIDPTFEKTHLPLDPKWQLRTCPFTIQGFERGCLEEADYQLNLKEALRNTKGLSRTQQDLLEGINGKEFNPKNNFDIGLGYLQIATGFNDQSTSIDSLTIGLFNKNLVNCMAARRLIVKYQSDIDSIFKKRIVFLKKEGVKGNRILTTIQHMIKSLESSYIKDQNSLTKRYNELSRRAEKYESYRKFVSQHNYLNTGGERIKDFDSTSYCLNLTNYCKSTVLSSMLSLEIDSLVNVTMGCFVQDSLLAQNCLKSKNGLVAYALNFNNELVTEDYQLIFSKWDSITIHFRNLMENFRKKRQNLMLIRASINRINEVENLMTEEFVKQIGFIKKITKFSVDSSLTVKFMGVSCSFIEETYRMAGIISRSYQQFIEGLMNFNSADYQVSLSLKGLPIENLHLFVKYDNELYISQKRFYENEKKMLKDVLSQCNSRRNRIDKRIKAYTAGSSPRKQKTFLNRYCRDYK